EPLKSQFIILTDELQKWIREREGADDWTPDQLARFQRDCQWLLESTAPEDDSIELVYRDRLMLFTRSLLELVHPGLLYDLEDCRTVAVGQHDQTARLRWFGICLLGVIIGFAGSINLNRHSPLYTFYRYRI